MSETSAMSDVPARFAIDEATRRRPEFSEAESTPIELSDGQEWYFRAPTTLEFVPVIGDDGSVELGTIRTFGPGFEALVTAVELAEGGEDYVVAMMRLGMDLLARNYDLKPAEYRSLLRFRPGDDGNRFMWQSIYNCSRGFDGPKPSAVGSASPSESTA